MSQVQAINMASGEGWTLYNGDCVEGVACLPDESVGYSVFSPPFESIFTYSDSERDLGNCESSEEFFTHFGFLVEQLYRVTKPGRLCSVHCMQLPSTMTRDGVIGLRDFRGGIIRCFTDRQWIYHSEVCIWKDPVTAMQRTKALGLLHKQVVKDSAMSRQGIADYVCTFRKPGKNPDPISGGFDHYIGDAESSEAVKKQNGNPSIDIWQRYASPVWMDIDQGRTLNARSAREDEDTRHMCPLQLDVIDRCLQLWSKPGDVVLSPFAGVGSEGVESIKFGRKFIGFELKESYFKLAAKYLAGEEVEQAVPGLFDE